MSARALAVVTLVILSGCGADARPTPQTPGAREPEQARAVAPQPAMSLRRSAVSRAVARGLGAFLQHVALDDRPVMLGGRFHGFRVAALEGDPAFWRGVDVRPGDVVTRVNGMPIEHPEEALEVFQSLDVASELRVDLERDGAPRELRYAIVDDEPARKADASAAR